MNGWNIEFNPKPIPLRCCDWDFWHDDNDGENCLSGVASSEADAKKQIKEIEENNRHFIAEEMPIFEGTREALDNLTIFGGK